MAFKDNINKLQSFIFGGETGNSYEAIQAQRAMADQMRSRVAGSAPGTFGEGLSALGAALAYRRADGKASRGEEQGRGEFNSAFQQLMGGYSAGYPQSTSYQQPSTPPGASQQQYTGTPEGPTDIREGIISTANSLGIDPLDLATAISYETAGTFDPTKNGPTTQWGQHQGLIQFGQPQQRQYGVDLSSREAAIASQLGENGAVARYLRGAGVQPGMGMMDIYSAINAGSVGRYNASDANNGGAPGTVADKVNNQMSGHREKAARLLGADYSAPPDPGSVYMPYQQNAQTQNVGGFDPRLVELMGNPYATEGQKAFMQMMIRRQMAGPPQVDPLQQLQLQQAQLGIQKSQLELQQMQNPSVDPIRQIELQRAQLELEALQNPERETVVVNGALVDKQTGEVVYQAAPGQSDEAFSQEQNLRKEFIGMPAVRDFSSQSQAYGRIVASANDPSAAGDMALIFNYMKLLDPGSTVREGEFATAQNAGGVEDRVVSLYNQLLNGQRLSDEQRADFTGRSGKLYDAAEQNFSSIRGQYETIANQYGIDPSRALPSFAYTGEAFQGAQPSQQQAPTPAASGQPVPQPGTPEYDAWYGSPDWAQWYLDQNGGQ